ncbi:MAG: transketolase [Candidatus Comchoanobacterales bacterium]
MIRDIKLLKDAASGIRMLAADAVESAQSGHPGMPLGMAEVAVVLWHHWLKLDPQNPQWFNRDRFVLSNGHGSMLLYALLHLSGGAITLDDLKLFRQLGSKTPGHPEYDIELGIETTTGPLGQGLANAVGMALAERIHASRFNHLKDELIDYHTYAMVGDGCLMEGISHEAAAFAGHQKLGKLIVLWDDNDITIDGSVSIASKEDVLSRFDAYGWQTLSVDGHDINAINEAIKAAHLDNRPTLIACKTVIGFGSDLAGSSKCHGAPLGKDVIEKMRHQLGVSKEPFHVEHSCYDILNKTHSGGEAHAEWVEKWLSYEKQYPQLAISFKALQQQRPLISLSHLAIGKNQATRVSSKDVLTYCLAQVKSLIGGSADLAGSNGIPIAKIIQPSDYSGQLIHYGVREFGMMAISNGLALSGLKTFCATFLTFSDYGRNAIRLAAQMKLPVTYILTHDSIGLGEDGPTHQPIEHLSSLRAMPNIDVWRPADDVETIVAWQCALNASSRPHVLALSRQSCPHLGDRDMDVVSKGGYILQESSTFPEVILIATGSEVSLAQKVYDVLIARGNSVRLVSMPCQEAFLRQDEAYQHQVLPKNVLRCAIEAAEMMSWYRFVDQGLVFGCDEYGHSAPAEQIYEAMGLTSSKIAARILEILQRRKNDVKSCY